MVTPSTRLSAALATLHWSPMILANVLGINERTVRRWIAGQNEPSVAVLEWVERLARCHEENPLPTKNNG